MWVIDLLVNLPSPDPEALAHPSTPEMLWAKECTLIESIKELGGASLKVDEIIMSYKLLDTKWKFQDRKITMEEMQVELVELVEVEYVLSKA
jgi:hypothetical protein